jgi:hypothetical protein
MINAVIVSGVVFAVVIIVVGIIILGLDGFIKSTFPEFYKKHLTNKHWGAEPWDHLSH